MICCYDGVHLGSLEKRVKFITRAQTICLFSFFSRRTKCRVVCVCVSVCVWVVYLCIGIIPIHSNEMLSFSNALSRVHRELTRSRSLSLIRSRSHSRASLQRWYYVHFVSCFKNQSFISWESFFSFFVWVMQFVKFNLSFDCFKMFNQLILVFPSRFFFFYLSYPLSYRFNGTVPIRQKAFSNHSCFLLFIIS